MIAFHTPAAVSTAFFLAMIAGIYLGALVFVFHRWPPFRLLGLLAAAACLIGSIGHLVALITTGG